MKTELEQALEWFGNIEGSIKQFEVFQKYFPEVFTRLRREFLCNQEIVEIWKKETQESDDLPDNMDAGDLMYGKEEYNETFNPEAHSSLIIDFDKVETIEEIAQRHSDQNHIIGDFYKLGFIEGVNWCKEQLKN